MYFFYNGVVVWKYNRPNDYFGGWLELTKLKASCFIMKVLEFISFVARVSIHIFRDMFHNN